MDMTDEQWAVLEPLIPEEEGQAGGRVRPWQPSRDVFNGILWILQTGACCQDLPDPYPPYQTCHRCFQQWVDKVSTLLCQVPKIDELSVSVSRDRL